MPIPPESSSLATLVRLPSEAPVNTTVSKLLPMLSRKMLPVVKRIEHDGVQVHQTLGVPPPSTIRSLGSPASLVAFTLVPVTVVSMLRC